MTPRCSKWAQPSEMSHSFILTFANIPWKWCWGDFCRAVTGLIKWQVAFNMLIRWLLSDSTPAWSVAWRNWAKIPSVSFIWCPSLADNIGLYVPACPGDHLGFGDAGKRLLPEDEGLNTIVLLQQRRLIHSMSCNEFLADSCSGWIPLRPDNPHLCPPIRKLPSPRSSPALL